MPGFAETAEHTEQFVTGGTPMFATDANLG